MAEFHETRIGRTFLEVTMPALVKAMNRVADEAARATEATAALTAALEALDLEAIAEAPEASNPLQEALEKAVQDAQENAPTPRPVPRSEKEVQAALMGMDVRPLVCPRCEGELLPTDESPDVFSCPECERLVNWLDALQASDRVYAQRKDKADG